MTSTHKPPAKGLVNDLLVRVAVGLQQGKFKSRSDANEGVATGEDAPLTCKAAMAVLFDQYFRLRHKNKQRKPISLVTSDGISDDSKPAKEALREEFLEMLKPFHSEACKANNQRKLYRPTGHAHEGVQVDPWPAGLEAQELFLKNLEHLATRLEELGGDLELDAVQAIVAELFGQSCAEDACKEINEIVGAAIRKGVRHETGTGQLIIPAVGGVVSPASANPPATPRHTFHGEKLS